MFFVLKADITVLESVGYSILGLAIVFAALILLMAIIKIQSALMNKNGKDTANNAAVSSTPAPAPAPAAPSPVATTVRPNTVAPGSAGEIKLYTVPDKTAAIVMAIVADSLHKPLNELRFISIKEVK